MVLVPSAYAGTAPSETAALKAAKTQMQTTAPQTVLELFTSQGCSSCPAANAYIRNLYDDQGGQDQPVLVLSYSVDYWDYLGWKDTFGKPEFSAHQRTYGQHFNGQVYTPQMVLNGAEHSSSYTPEKVRKSKLDAHSFDVTISENTKSDGLKLHIKQTKAQAAPVPSKHAYTVMAITYKPGIHSVPVKRGENKGRTVRLANVVTGCANIATFTVTKDEPVSLTQTLPPVKKGEALAILIQAKKGGPILSATLYAP